MWHMIDNGNNLVEFMKTICYFHDSCIKEIKYNSGAYVDDDLAMYPINKDRVLKVIVQRQFADIPMIELEFQGLKYLRLYPVDEQYTCEILGATMFFKDGCVYWCDCDDLNEVNIDNYLGTVICASKFRWRQIDGCMGNTSFFYQSSDR